MSGTFPSKFAVSFNRNFRLVAILAARAHRFLLLSCGKHLRNRFRKCSSYRFHADRMPTEIKLWFRVCVDQYREIVQPRLYIVELTIFATVSEAMLDKIGVTALLSSGSETPSCAFEARDKAKGCNRTDNKKKIKVTTLR